MPNHHSPDVSLNLNVRGLNPSATLAINEKSDELAMGLVNYHSGDIRKIMGLKSREIENVLGFKYDDEVINRDNLVITNPEEGNGLCQLRT